jgi:hypothetical protein
MSYQELHELGPVSAYENVALANGLGALEDFRVQRADIAYTAARHIIEACGGETLDMRLYYAAMFGRSFLEGALERDPNLAVPQEIARSVSDPAQQGRPVLVRDSRYPNENVEVGVLGSFSSGAYEPVTFEVRSIATHPDYRAWEGNVALAVRKVVPGMEGSIHSYFLAPEVSRLTVCRASVWDSSPAYQGVERVAEGTGGVELGDFSEDYLSSESGTKSYHKKAFWLREYLAAQAAAR